MKALCIWVNDIEIPVCVIDSDDNISLFHLAWVTPIYRVLYSVKLLHE